MSVISSQASPGQGSNIKDQVDKLKRNFWVQALLPSPYNHVASASYALNLRVFCKLNNNNF